MAILNTVISDEVDALFRKEIAKRYGMKKGNIQLALEDAIRLWSKQTTIDKLKNVAINGGYSERGEARRTLKEMGEDAMDALADIASSSVSGSEKEEALKFMRAIIEDEKERRAAMREVD